MTEEELKKVETTEEAPKNAEEYVAAIKALKEKTVSKEYAEKLEKDNAALIKAVMNGETVSANEQQQEKPDIKALREKLRTSGEREVSNAEYIETALKLREAVIAEGGLDPFLPSGAKAKPTLEDIQKAEHTAQGFQYCLDEARDAETGVVDKDIFNAVLKKITAEDNPVLTARLKANARNK